MVRKGLLALLALVLAASCCGAAYAMQKDDFTKVFTGSTFEAWNRSSMQILQGDVFQAHSPAAASVGVNDEAPTLGNGYNSLNSIAASQTLVPEFTSPDSGFFGSLVKHEGTGEIWAGTYAGQNSRILVRRNGTWQVHTTVSDAESIYRMIYHPVTNTLYANLEMNHKNPCIYRLDGDTWVSTGYGHQYPESKNPYGLGLGVGADGYMYAGVATFPDVYVWRSADGVNWQSFTTTPQVATHWLPAGGQTFACTSDFQNGNLLVLSGTNWTSLWSSSTGFAFLKEFKGNLYASGESSGSGVVHRWNGSSLTKVFDVAAGGSNNSYCHQMAVVKDSSGEEWLVVTWSRTWRSSSGGARVYATIDGTNWSLLQQFDEEGECWAAAQGEDEYTLYVGTRHNYGHGKMYRANFDTTPPSVPANIQAAAQPVCATVVVTWSASTDNGRVAGYKVLRNGTEIATTTTTSYTDTGLPQNTTYSYTVSAFDGGENNSPQSAAAVVTTPVAEPCWEFASCLEGWTAYQSLSQFYWEPTTWFNPTGFVQGLEPWVVSGNSTTSAKACPYVWFRAAFDADVTNPVGVGWRRASNGVWTMSWMDANRDSAYHDYHVKIADGEMYGHLDYLAFGPGQGPAGGFVLDYYRPVYSPSHDAYWGFDSDEEGWVYGANISGLTQSGGCLVGTATNSDPFVYTQWPAIDASYHNCVKIRMKTSAGSTGQLFWKKNCAGWDSGHQISWALNSDNQFHEYSLNMKDDGMGWSGIVNWMRLDPMNAAGTFQVDSISVFRDYDPPTIPGTPTDAGETTTNPSITFNWTAGSDAGSSVKDYQCQIGTSPEANNFFDGWVTGLSKTITGTSGNTYYCRVRVRDVANNISSWSQSSNGILLDSQAPSVPTSVTATAQSETSVKVTWTASTDDVGVEGYKIFRNGDQIGTSATTSYTNTGLLPGTTYSYRVSAYDAAGNDSAQSSPPETVTTPDNTPPSVPTNVSATAKSQTSVEVTWTASTDNVGVVGYKVFRNGAQVGTSGNMSYTDTGLQSGTSYSYTVLAYDAANNESGHSSPPAVVTTESPSDTTPPSVPTNLEAVAMSPMVVRLTWTASTDDVGVEGYRVFRNGVPAGTSHTTSYMDSGLAADTGYTYSVSAYDAAANESAQSSPAQVATPAAMDIAEAKLQPDSATVGLLSKRISVVLNNSFYIQEENRNIGIKVVALEPVEGLTAGILVDIGGVLDTDLNGERFVLGHVIIH